MNLESIYDKQNVFYRCVEDTNEAVMITDKKGDLVYVNPAWVRIYGYSKSEAIGKTPALLHSGHHDREFYKKMWEGILDPNKGYWKGEITNRSKSGRTIPVLLTITPYRSENNEILGHMGIALDMSEQKRLEAEVFQQDRLASLGILVSGLAHEVGTPLGVVRGRAELIMMKEGVQQDAGVKNSLETIVSQIDRISKLISSLLRYSRSSDDIKNQDIFVADVISELTNLLGQTLKQNSIELITDIDPTIAINADFNRLQQILMNLWVNAIHAIQESISQGGSQRNFLKVLVKRDEVTSKVVLIVEDSGCGIKPENLKKLFKPFFTTKEVGKGTGLGLAIVSKLISEINGEISLESTYGVGTTFFIKLNPAKSV